jgi:hypothetical protein
MNRFSAPAPAGGYAQEVARPFPRPQVRLFSRPDVV